MKTLGAAPAGMRRRGFLKRGASALAGAALLPRSVRGANERLNVAFIGAGGKGGGAVKNLENHPFVNIVAFADVDERRAAATYKAHPGVPRFRDFRRMLDAGGIQIDAVVISTPDHTHHCAAKSCMRMGKHVYLEKPLTHTIAQARDLVEAERRFGVVCQMGNQGHSGAGLAMLDAWVKAGVLGEVREARAWCGSSWSVSDGVRPASEPAPQDIDWDLWLGPAPAVPHSTKYYPTRWRGWSDFGEGSFGDWACHNMDAPYTVFDLGYPSRIRIESTGPVPFSFPNSVKLVYTFPAKGARPEMRIAWCQGKEYPPERPPELEPDRQMGSEGGGTLIIGSKATAMMPSHAGTPRIIPESKHREMAPGLPSITEKRSSHFDNWVRACRGEEKTRSHFAYAGLLTEVMLLGNIAIQLNTGLELDPERRAILGNPDAARMMAPPPPRKGWEV